jgi:tetratricopeptide (TPR) repeat protein
MKAIVAIPGVIGGLSGIFIGFIELLWYVISAVSSHMPRSWIESGLISPDSGAGIYILLGLIGATSSLLYPRNGFNLGWMMILCGLLGFPVGYASGSYANMGWISWIIPGILLITAGLISLAGPDKITSSLPLLNSDNKRNRFLGLVLYSGLFIGVQIMAMTGLLLLGSIPDTSPQGMATQDQRDLESAGITQSMGLYSKSLTMYDEIIARNQSNYMAWYEKGSALSRMGRHDEALVCFDRALEIKSGFKEAEDAKARTLLAMSAPANESEGISPDSALNQTQ